MTDNQHVRTRFAPSPTGFLHVGGVRTALFAWLVARQAGGQFILRIEDTDKAREVTGSEAHIIESLKWLGLAWDEGPDNGGPNGPYRQSQRLEIYKEWAQKLIDAGRAYADSTTPAQLDELRAEAKAKKQPFLFRNYRPSQPLAWDGSQPLRFRSEPKNYKWHDEVMGELAAGPEVVDDFIIIKSDGYPTYNFAHIVDDHLMNISHVIRSQEFVASMPKFLNLYDALGIAWPKFATLPYVMGPDGQKKLSKRDGAKDILDYRAEGYLPEALVSFLATLGWNDGSQQEVFTVDELVQKFALNRVQRSGARFDEQRLKWVDGTLIRDLPTDQLYAKIDNRFWGPAETADETYKKRVLALVQERLKYFAELADLTDFFFQPPSTPALKQLLADPPDKQLAKAERSSYRPMLQKVIEALEKASFESEALRQTLNDLLQELGTRPGVLFALIRIAISGKPASPEIAGSLAVLGKDESLKRLKTAAELLDA